MSQEQLVKAGRKFEYEIFGTTAPNRRHPRQEHFPKYEFARVIVMQKELGWDPVNPKTHLGREWYECVQHHIDLLGGNALSLKLYCALGSVIDGWGIDGFFELEGCVATFDLTTNHRKETPACDVVFYDYDKGESLWRVSYRIALVLMHRRPRNMIYETGS